VANKFLFLLLLRGRAAYTIYSIWRFTAAVYFQVIEYYIRHGNSVLASVYQGV